MQEKFPKYYFVNWTETHKNFFRAIQIEKRVMMIILFMIVSVAIFNIISTLVMIVNEKKSEIALLRAFGASKGFIVSIFVLLGTIIGFIGTCVGVIFGLTVAINLSEIVLFIESIFGSNLFTSEVYFLNDLPSSIDSSEILFISAFAFTLTILATIYPAFKSTKSHPAKVLRADI
jgi:lipoprotein-releasing system permease protein